MSLCSCFWAWKKNNTNDNEDHSTEDIELTTFNNHNNQRSSESLVGADHNQTSQSDDRRSPPITIDHHETPNTPFNIDHHEPAAKIPPITIDDPKLKSLAKNVRTVQASSSSSSGDHIYIHTYISSPFIMTAKIQSFFLLACSFLGF